MNEKKTELKLSEAEIAKIAGKAASQIAGAALRDATIKLATETAYQAGNNTDIIAGIAEKIGKGIDGGTALVGGIES